MGYKGYEIEITDWRRNEARIKGVYPIIKFHFSSPKDLRINFRKAIDIYLGGKKNVKNMDGKE